MALNTKRYKMDHPKRGKAIIIKNWHFAKPELDDLQGSDVDVENITRGLKHNRFDDVDVEISNDLSTREIMDLAKTVALYDHKDADCMVFCINSHGSKRGIYGTDYKVPKDAIDIQDIVNEFVGKKCPDLVGKPKIFIINACRGKQTDVGVDNKAYVTMSASCNDSTIPNQPQRISTSADILIFKSSYPGYYSYQNDTVGSYFMKSLGDHLFDYGQVKPLREIFDMVKDDVASNAFKVKNQKQIAFQMPQVEETLRKQIYFGPNLKSRNDFDDRPQSDMPEMMKEEGGNKLTKVEMTHPTCQRGVMKEEDRNKITNHWKYIEENIKDHVSKLAKDLMSAQVIDLKDVIILNDIPDADERVNKLLLIILGRGHQAYQGFLSCLSKSGFDHLTDVINGDKEPPSIRSRPRGQMAEEDLEKVRVNYGALKDQMDGNLVSGKLFETGVFDTNDRKQIKNAPAAQQNEVLLTLLIKCGPEAFKKFLSCLEELKYDQLKRNLENGTSSTVGSQRRRRGLIPEAEQLRVKHEWFLDNISNPEEVASALYTQSIFDRADLKKVEEASREDRVGVLLDIVQDCSTGAYDSFMSVLRSSGYTC